MRSMRKRLGFTASSHPVVEGAARPVYDEPQPVSVAFISETGAAASSRPLARRGGRAATTSEAIHGYPYGAVRVMRHPASSRYGRRCCLHIRDRGRRVITATRTLRRQSRHHLRGHPRVSIRRRAGDAPPGLFEVREKVLRPAMRGCTGMVRRCGNSEGRGQGVRRRRRRCPGGVPRPRERAATRAAVPGRSVHWGFC